MIHNASLSIGRSAILTLGIVAICGLGACDSQSESEPGLEQQDNDDHNGQDDDNQQAQNDASENDHQDNQQSPDPDPEPDADEVALTIDGEPQLSIIIGESAGDEVQQAADELADYLYKISGASFEIVEDTGAFGIVVGELEDFEELPMTDVEFGDGTLDREDYLMRTKEDHGLYLLGASPLAVRFAVWDLLYRLGHRQFFPTDTWEVIPDEDTLNIAVDTLERPDYYNREAPRTAMRIDKRPWAQQPWEDWQLRNRTTPNFTLSTGHVYDSVISANQDAFDNNPDYFGLVDGQRTSDAQPNVAHPDVQQIFVDYALDQFASNPGRHSVAMDPRDGPFWSESDASTAIGGPSEQAVFMANMVAEEVVDHYGDDKFVGMYGYSHHSPPPEIDAHPNVIVSLATAFIRGGYTFEEMLDGWSERANMIGIREYYSLWEWHYSLPGNGARAADTEYLKEVIPHHHEKGARFINAESNNTWGGYGLGYYLASRMLWDVDEADRMDELIDDFLLKSFGDAKEPMGDFYALIDGSAKDPLIPDSPRQLNEDMVGRMYRYLEQARQLVADDDEARARIDDLILYTHYVELYRAFDNIAGSDRQQAFDDLVSFTWRIRDRMMTENVEMTRYIDHEVRSDDNLQWGAGYSQHEPADHHRVDEDTPFSDAEIVDILQSGIDNNELLDLDFEPWTDSGDVIPAGFAPDDRGAPGTIANRGDIEMVLHTDDGTLPELTLSAGHIYDDRGPMQWDLVDDDGDYVDSGEVAPDEEDYVFDLSEEPGTYRLSFTNTGQGFLWDYEPRGASLTILSGGVHELERNYYDRLYFYVPEDTDAIHLAGTLLDGRYDFIDGDGVPVDVDDIDVDQGYTSVPVPAGQDGEVWSLEMTSFRADIRFLNVPGYAAFSPDELLLPVELDDEL